MDGPTMAAPARLVAGMRLTPEQRRRIEDEGCAVLLHDAVRQRDRALDLAGEAEAWFGPGLDGPLLERAPRLRWLQTASAGADYVLSPAVVASDLVVTVVRHRHTGVCDHALALMLALARDLPRAVRQQARSAWDKTREHEVIRLEGARVLVLGTGQIGAGIAARVAPFGMVAEACNRSGAAHPAFARVRPVSQLAEAVAGADWVVNAVPLTPHTNGLVSAAVIAAMPPGAVFVNVSRGRTVDQAALTDALRSGRLRAAALDVFEREPLPPEDALWTLPNVLVTPHTAGVNAEGDPVSLGLDALIGNIRRLRGGLPVDRPVDKQAGY